MNSNNQDNESVIEFEFLGEEGSGLGPTLEYYSIVAKELVKPENGILKLCNDNTYFPFGDSYITEKFLGLIDGEGHQN